MSGSSGKGRKTEVDRLSSGVDKDGKDLLFEELNKFNRRCRKRSK